MPPASIARFKVDYGIAVFNPRPAVKLRDAIRSGALKSAWGDMDEPDSTGLGTRRDTVPTSAESDEEMARYKRERETSRKAQEVAVERVKQAQLAKAEAERMEREEAAQEALEGIEGYGSF